MSHNSTRESAIGIRRNTRRAMIVLAATAANGLAWVGGRQAHVDYMVQTPLGERQITVVLVIVATTISGLAGWAVYQLAGAAHEQRRACMDCAGCGGACVINRADFRVARGPGHPARADRDPLHRRCHPDCRPASNTSTDNSLAGSVNHLTKRRERTCRELNYDPRLRLNSRRPSSTKPRRA
jgi:Family of unknown function (DUF6069)